MLGYGISKKIFPMKPYLTWLEQTFEAFFIIRKKKKKQDRCHQWSFRPDPFTSVANIVFSLKIRVVLLDVIKLERPDVRTDESKDNMCENNDHYQPWLSEWIKTFLSRHASRAFSSAYVNNR